MARNSRSRRRKLVDGQLPTHVARALDSAVADRIRDPRHPWRALLVEQMPASTLMSSGWPVHLHLASSGVILAGPATPGAYYNSN